MLCINFSGTWTGSIIEKALCLQDIFSTLGVVSEVRIVKDRATGNSAGSAFVKFEDHQAAAMALQTINGRVLYNKVRA